jgi:hypothetical protein
VQHLAVADGLHRQAPLRVEQPAGGPAQRPPAVLRPLVGEPFTGVAQQVGEQFAERDRLRQRDIDAALRRGDRDPGQPDADRGRHGRDPLRGSRP